jgi:hypothetical protein
MSAQSRAQTIDRARLDQHRSAYELAERAAGACTAHWRMDVDRPWLEIDDGPDDDPELGELEQQDELAAATEKREWFRLQVAKRLARARKMRDASAELLAMAAGVSTHG